MKTVPWALAFPLILAQISRGQIVNGDFENPAIPSEGYVTYSQGSSFPGWEVYSGTVDLVNMAYYSPSQILDLNGTGPGAIRQTLQTTAGQKYSLTLSWQPNTLSGPFVSVPALAYLALNGVTYGRYSYVDGPAQPVTDSIVFMGSGSDLLALFSGSPGTGAIMFDNISVTPVSSDTPLSPALPEPSSYSAMFGVGLLAYGVLRRNQKHRCRPERAITY